MKHLKSYKIFESTDYALSNLLRDLRIIDYHLNEDGSIDVNNSVTLFHRNFNEIPFKLNRVNGYFTCDYNKLTSLKNCPRYVEGEFACKENKLTSLEFGPEYVGTNYYCNNNQLITLKGCIDEVYENFNCAYNKLTSLEFCPMEVTGDFNCSHNKLEYLDRSPFVKKGFICYDMFDKEPEFSGNCKKLYW